MDAMEERISRPVSGGAGVLIQIPEGLEVLALRYIASRQKELPAFQELLERSDFETIRRMSHNMKGTGTSYGFPDITRFGALIESASKEQNLQEISTQVRALSTYVLAAVQQLH